MSDSLRKAQQLEPGIWSEWGTWLKYSAPVLSLLPASFAPPYVSAPPSIPSWNILADIKVFVILRLWLRQSQMYFPDLPAWCHWFHCRAIFLGILERFLKFQYPRISLSTDPVSPYGRTPFEGGRSELKIKG
jgi:hypothetical protein